MCYIRLLVSTVCGGGVNGKGVRSGGGGDIGSKKPSGVAISCEADSHS